MSDTVAILAAEVDTKITNQTEEESITPAIHGDLLKRVAILIDERIFAGGDTRTAALTIGTKDSYALRFITNNLHRATMTAAGRLLLGTETESTYAVDVVGTGRFSSDLRAGGANGTVIYSDKVILGNATSTTVKRNHNSIAGMHMGAVESGGGGFGLYFYPNSNGYYGAITESGMYVTSTARTTAASNHHNSKALLHAASTTKGALICRMTGAEAEAISPGATEDMLLVSITNGNGSTITSKGWWYYDHGTGWLKL